MEWLPIPGLRSVNGIVWMLPVITFSVIVGIGESAKGAAGAVVCPECDLGVLCLCAGLDYDIFLLVAIEDARRVKRFDNKSAIVAGVCQTGNVITSGNVAALASHSTVASQHNSHLVLDTPPVAPCASWNYQ